MLAHIALVPKVSTATSGGDMIRTLVSVAAVSGVLIVIVFQLTFPYIKENKAEALRRAVYEVVPGTSSVRNYLLAEDGTLQHVQDSDGPGTYFFAGYDDGQQLTGVAIQAIGQGFADKIKILYGYAPEKQILVGMKVLESKETPGLGDKIEKDPIFRQNFEALDVRLSEDGQSLVHQIEVVKSGKKTSAWQISAITGATISSKAIGAILQESTARQLPRVARNTAAMQVNDAASQEEND